MRKTTLLLVVGLLALGATSAWAQGGRWVIQPLAGYRTSGSFGVRPDLDVVLPFSGIRIPDGFAYGISLGYRLTPLVTFEAQWTRSSGTAQAIATNTLEPNVDLFEMNEDQLHANFIFYFSDADFVVRPFFVTGLGATLADPKVEGVGTTSRFSWNLGLGFEKMFNDKVGFRVQAKWFSTYINDSAVWWYDYWWGGWYLVPVSQYMGQWDFTGGLVFRF
jgi:hypothetical protein